MLTLQRYNENRWRPFTAFPLKISDIVSSSGSGAGVVASSHWVGEGGRCTLKGIKVTNFSDYFKYIFLNNSRNFRVFPLVLRGVAPIF